MQDPSHHPQAIRGLDCPRSRHQSGPRGPLLLSRRLGIFALSINRELSRRPPYGQSFIGWLASFTRTWNLLAWASNVSALSEAVDEVASVGVHQRKYLPCGTQSFLRF